VDGRYASIRFSTKSFSGIFININPPEAGFQPARTVGFQPAQVLSASSRLRYCRLPAGSGTAGFQPADHFTNNIR
jgi:hypothetical protein